MFHLLKKKLFTAHDPVQLCLTKESMIRSELHQRVAVSVGVPVLQRSVEQKLVTVCVPLL